jgi:hypothetical protein
MLTPKEIVTVAEKMREIPTASYAALAKFLYDSASEATEQALALECPVDSREVLRGYAKGLRDALGHLHDLHGDGHLVWPGVAQYLAEQKTSGDEGED